MGVGVGSQVSVVAAHIGGLNTVGGKHFGSDCTIPRAN